MTPQIYNPIKQALIADAPQTFVNIYGAKSPMYFTVGQGYHLDLTDSFMENMIVLCQNKDYRTDGAFPKFGDLPSQAIVHVKVGVLPRGQQTRVVFYFQIPPHSPNILQIFVNDGDSRGPRLESSYAVPDATSSLISHRSVLVVGDGGTNIDVFFRPAQQDSNFRNAVLFERIEIMGV